MTFEVEIDGRLVSVAIERAGKGRYRVAILPPAGSDGPAQEPRVVDAARVGDYGLSLLLDGGGNASREVQIAPAGARGEFLVSLDGRTVPVMVNGRRTRSSRRCLDAWSACSSVPATRSRPGSRSSSSRR
jgi:hypothetical protein